VDPVEDRVDCADKVGIADGVASEETEGSVEGVVDTVEDRVDSAEGVGAADCVATAD